MSIAWTIGKSARCIFFNFAKNSLGKMTHESSPGPAAYKVILHERKKSPCYSMSRARRPIIEDLSPSLFSVILIQDSHHF